jgi:hypothetical protein
VLLAVFLALHFQISHAFRTSVRIGCRHSGVRSIQNAAAPCPAPLEAQSTAHAPPNADGLHALARALLGLVIIPTP